MNVIIHASRASFVPALNIPPFSLSPFNEFIVCELVFGHKHFFTVLYRNPKNKANSVEFKSFLNDLENLREKN